MFYVFNEQNPSNVEFYRSAGVIQDLRDPAITTSVQVTVDNIEGLEAERRSDNDSPDYVYFYGAGATAANITVGKAYAVNEVTGVDTQDGGAGTFYITEANVTVGDYARIGSGNCFVGFESVLRADSEAQMTGINPATGKITFKARNLTDLTNGTNVSLTSSSELSSVDTIPGNFYTAADVNTTAKTFSITSSDFRFHDTSVAKTGYNKLGVTTVGIGGGVHAIVTGGASDMLLGAYKTSASAEGNTQVTDFNTEPDFLHFETGSTGFSANVYPILHTQQIDESSATFSTIIEPTVTTTSTSNVVVYKGEFANITGRIKRLQTDSLLRIDSFDNTRIGTYGLGTLDPVKSRDISFVETYPGLSGRQFALAKPDLTDSSNSNVTLNPSNAVRDLKTNFIVDIDRNANNTADIRIF